MGHKAVETTRYINNGFGPEASNNCTVQCWFKKFRKGDKSLKAEERGGQSLEIENDQLTAIIEADPCYNDLKFMVRNCDYFCTNLINTCLWFHGFQVWPLVQKQQPHQRTCYKCKPIGSTPELLIQKREGQQYVF